MKPAPFLALALALVCLCAGAVQAAEVYWDPNVSRADEILGDTDAEVMHDSRIRTPPAVRIYDSADDEMVAVDMIGEETEEPAVRLPRQTAPSQTVPSVVRPRRSDSTQSRTLRPKSSDTTTSPEKEQKAAAKKPKKKQRDVPAETSIEESEKPESQRAKPSGLEVPQPAEPKSKLQWGR